MILQTTNNLNKESMELANECDKKALNFNTIWGTEYFVYCTDEIKEEDIIKLIKGMLLMREFKL